MSVDPSKTLPALEDKKDESRNRSRISFYRWIGQNQQEDQEDDRQVTFKPDEKPEREPKEGKEGIEAIVRNLLEPTVSYNETKEYERCVLLMRWAKCRYIAHPRALTMTVPEKAHPEYTAYVEDAYVNNYDVEDNDLKLYETSISLPGKAMMMRAALVEKDEITRRKAQGFQTWVKWQKK